MNRTLIILVLILSCYLGKKENNYNNKTNSISILFQKIENEMKYHYDYVEANEIFEDPLGRVEYLFKKIKAVAPQLFTETKLYKYEILNLLTDTVFQKNDFTDDDIVYVLYNLSIDDYVNLLDSVLIMYRKGNINQEIFERFIFQDDFVSISIYRNYKNENLQYFLHRLLKDNELISKLEIGNKHFKETIISLKDGTSWEGDKNECGLKVLYKNVSPILDLIVDE